MPSNELIYVFKMFLVVKCQMYPLYLIFTQIIVTKMLTNSVLLKTIKKKWNHI